MTVRHEADSDELGTVADITDTEHYTLHSEVTTRGTRTSATAPTSYFPAQTNAQLNHERRMQRAAIQTEWGGSEDGLNRSSALSSNQKHVS